ncbi:MAG: hypothetical protein DLM62_00520 [Pseudonocardiales bacterium]|nr:MAG: hypothetical protein DLM62_00520 [Pseudonocardiales bacterium]
MELSGTPPAALQAEALLDRMRAYAEASRAPNTWRAYQSDLRHFAAWCAQRGIAEPVPATATAVAAYLTDFAGVLSIATLQRRLYALSALHRAGNFPSPADAPEVHTVFSGIKRTHRSAPVQKTPTGTALIAAMCATLGERPLDVRDRAVLLVGFAGAFRRSELVAFDVADLTDTDDRPSMRTSSGDLCAPPTAAARPATPPSGCCCSTPACAWKKSRRSTSTTSRSRRGGAKSSSATARATSTASAPAPRRSDRDPRLARRAEGGLPEQWRAAFLAVPREVFIPEEIWRYAGDDLVPLRRCEESQEWLRRAYGPR